MQATGRPRRKMVSLGLLRAMAFWQESVIRKKGPPPITQTTTKNPHAPNGENREASLPNAPELEPSRQRQRWRRAGFAIRVCQEGARHLPY